MQRGRPPGGARSGSSSHHLHTSCSLPAVFNCVTEEDKGGEKEEKEKKEMDLQEFPPSLLLSPRGRISVQTCHRCCWQFFFFSFLENIPLFSPSSPVLNTRTCSQLAHRRNFFEAGPPGRLSSRGALQPITQLIHTLPHLSYLLYYHPGQAEYPQRPGTPAGYQGGRKGWGCGGLGDAIPPQPTMQLGRHSTAGCPISLQLAQQES